MVAETREHSVGIGGVPATLVDVVVAGHTVELVLSYDVEEAGVVHGASFNDGVDEIMQMEVAALGDSFDDGTLHAVASGASYVMNGRCFRIAKIKHCSEIEPANPAWTVAKPHWIRTRRQPWGCVPGMPPASHDDLPPEDEVTRFLRWVAERALKVLSDDALRPDFDSRAAVPLGSGYRGYNLWYSRYPWSQWDMSYLVSLRERVNHPEDDEGSLWDATVGFTYLRDGGGKLESELEGLRVHERQSARTDEVGEESGQVSRYVATEVSLESDGLDDAFAIELSDVLARFIECITPVVDERRFRYRARNATVYEMLVLRDAAESVGGILTWNRSEGTWNYETSDPLISHVLEGAMAQGHADMWVSLSTDCEVAGGLEPVEPTDPRFVRALVDDLQHCGAGFSEFREVTCG